MNPFSEQLRSGREARGITLADIARTTRINIKYLEALEQGAFDVLPQTYIRAFIRSYAEAIGTPPERLLHQYDLIVTERYTGASGAPPAPVTPSLSPTAEKTSLLDRERRLRAMFIGGAVVVVLLLALLYVFDTIGTGSVPSVVTERPFQEVVKEQERTAPAPAVTDTADTSSVPALPPPPDSLVLRAVAADSVWITISRDSLPPRSGYMLKGRYRTYVARKRFTVSLSDGGAIRFILNGREIGTLGPRGERVRNHVITAERLNP